MYTIAVYIEYQGDNMSERRSANPKVIAEERTVSDVVSDIIYRYWEVVQR